MEIGSTTQQEELVTLSPSYRCTTFEDTFENTQWRKVKEVGASHSTHASNHALKKTYVEKEVSRDAKLEEP